MKASATSYAYSGWNEELLAMYTADGEAAVLAAAVRGIDIATVEAQVVGAARLVRSRGRVGAAAADIAQRAADVAAGIREIVRGATNLGRTS